MNLHFWINVKLKYWLSQLKYQYMQLESIKRNRIILSIKTQYYMFTKLNIY